MTINAFISAICNDCEYPITTEQLLKKHSELNFEAPNGGIITIEDAFGVIDPQEFESPEELQEHMLTALPEAAIGRKYYDDRGGAVDVSNVSF